jgi:hypothetical protein
VRALDDHDGPARQAAARALAAVGEGAVARALLAPLVAGAAAEHGGLALRVVGGRDALDEARRSADDLAILLERARRALPADALRALAEVADVVLVEPGQRPDPHARLDCAPIRAAAAEELKKRGLD